MENLTYDGDIDVFQHQIQLWSIFRSVATGVVQHIVSTYAEAEYSHKLDLSSERPIPGLCLWNLIGGFWLQFYVVENPLDADDVLLNIASGPHNPVLQ